MRDQSTLILGTVYRRDRPHAEVVLIIKYVPLSVAVGSTKELQRLKLTGYRCVFHWDWGSLHPISRYGFLLIPDSYYDCPLICPPTRYGPVPTCASLCLGSVAVPCSFLRKT